MIERLGDLIACSEDWLTARILHYAKVRGYAPMTSTLEQAWKASICGMSAPLLWAIQDRDLLFPMTPDADHLRDPIANYGIEVAQRHRTRGIPLGLFLGLIKGYRQTYLDLVAEGGFSAEEGALCNSVIHSFFDRVEIGICDEWSSWTADARTDQLAAQNRQITEEKNKYLTIFESLSNPVILLSGSGEIENMNHAAARLFSPDAVPGGVYYGKPPLAVARLMGTGDGTDPALATEVPVEREIATALGKRWFTIKTQRMLDVTEKNLCTVMIMTDVTDYRRARELAEASSKAKSTFLATMSHEIRTPIHGILGLAELLERGADPETQRGYAAAIVRSGEALSAVVADILDYSKIEAGAIDVERVTFRVSDIVADVFDLLQPAVARKPDLRLVLDSAILPTVTGDPGKLRQILLNLVGNAVKFTEQGSIRLTIETAPEADLADELRITVTDTGTGIAAERLDAIFEPFTQADSSISRRFGGSGLGLAICRRLVTRMGGRISVESKLGVGSRFTITLPFHDAPAAGPAAPRLLSGPQAWPARALDILVVEDNDVNALVAEGLLSRMGHRPHRVASGRAALASVATGAFALVLLDLRLPDMEGAEIARRIRALSDPARAAVPIIALSAHAMRDDIQACLDAGMNDFLGKPFRSDRLELALRRVLGVRSPLSVLPSPAARPADSDVDEVRIALRNHIAELGPDHAGLIVAAFRSCAIPLAADIEQSAAAGAWPTVADIAHRLKGASLHVGLTALSQRAAAAELAARSGDAADLVAAVADEVRRSVALLDQVWSAILAGQGQPANM